MYPKIFTHREDRHQQVVVANAEQEAQLPDDYRPSDVAGKSIMGAGGAVATPGETLLLSPEYAKFLADRDKLDMDRKALTEGYKADKALLDADRALLDAERAQFDADKALLDDTSVTEDATTVPVKRTRVAKEA